MRSPSGQLSTIGSAIGDEFYTETASSKRWLIPGIRREFIHELGYDLEDISQEYMVTVEPSSFKTNIHIKSTVRATGARALRSAPYLAAVRRREAKKIAELVASLPAITTDAEDFIAWAHEPLDRIRNLIDKLSTAEEFRETEFEGNSCEILRQLRDTFLGQGWQSYRDDCVCATTVSILNHLATEDEISSDNVYASLDKLLDAGLSPAIGIPRDDVDEEEIPD